MDSFPRPVLPLATLSAASTDAEVIDAYVQTVLELTKEVNERDQAIAACSSKAREVK